MTRNVEKAVSIPALRYLEYALTKSHAEPTKSSQAILDNTHPALKYEVLMTIYNPLFMKIMGLNDLPQQVLNRLAQNAIQVSFAPGQTIIDVRTSDAGVRHQ